jgi:carbonic anhydrase/acetyltransferase-like protein (isoleucine patch superfamily)
VELVRTKVGPRVRVNHMTYLGDATVEEQVNIGAGTITANYDGRQKHPTHIGKGAFIGSDTVLIAPVKIGAGAVTGAGSVVTKAHDVPAKGVVVGVPARPLDHRAAEADGKVKVERPAAVSRPPAQLSRATRSVRGKPKTKSTRPRRGAKRGARPANGGARRPRRTGLVRAVRRRVSARKPTRRISRSKRKS